MLAAAVGAANADCVGGRSCISSYQSCERAELLRSNTGIGILNQGKAQVPSR